MNKNFDGYHVTVARGYDDLHFRFSFDNIALMVSLIELVTNHNVADPRDEKEKELEITINLYKEEEKQEEGDDYKYV